MGQRRIDEATPAGGAYSVATIDDETGRIVEITEHAADGSVMARNYAARADVTQPSDETAGGADGRHRLDAPAVVEGLRGRLTSVEEARRVPAAGGLPQAPGLYAWWVRRGAIAAVEGPSHPSGSIELLYVGLAPRRTTSRATLRSRVRGQHLSGSIGSSTFRQSLAALLADGEKWTTMHTGSRARLLPVHNRALSEWQRRNLWLAWVEHSRPWEIEEQVIALMEPPLNLADNKAHPLHAHLSHARKRLRNSAAVE